MTLSRRSFLHAGAATLGALTAGTASRGPVYAQPRITTIDLTGATLFQGAGANVIAVPGPDGALMIDGGRAANHHEVIPQPLADRSRIRAHHAQVERQHERRLTGTHRHPPSLPVTKQLHVCCLLE